MGFVGLLFLVVCLILVGAGLILGVVAVVAAVVLTALGIISGSAAIGVARRSPKAGFLSLAVLSGGALGLVAGPAVAWAASTMLTDQPFSASTVLLTGVASGLIAGAVVGWLVFFVAAALARRLWGRVEVR